MKIKTIGLTVALCFFAGAACFAADDPQVGTWKLNETKSKPTPGTGKNNTVVYEAAGDEVKVTIDGTDADGKPTHDEWTGKFDGKDYRQIEAWIEENQQFPTFVDVPENVILNMVPVSFARQHIARPGIMSTSRKSVSDEPAKFTWHKGNEESRKAFETIRDRLTEQQERVLRAIRASDNGLTAEEIAEKLGTTVNCVSGRATELKIAGKIYKAGVRLTRSGCSAAILKVT